MSVPAAPHATGNIVRDRELSLSTFRPVWLENPLARHIAWVVVIKLAVIGVLFYAFFAGRSVSVDDARIAEHLSATQAAQAVPGSGTAAPTPTEP